MRRARLLAGAVLASALALTTALPATAAQANPKPPPDPFHAGTVASDINLYVARGGHAEIKLAPGLQAKVKAAGASLKYLHPFSNIPGRDTLAGFRMPVGNRYDAIQLDTRFTYPGGLVLTNPKLKKTFSFNGVSLYIEPVIAGFYAHPWVGDKQLGKKFKLVDASFVEALTTGGFFAPHFEDGQFSWGPTNVSLRVTAELSDALKSVGVKAAKGEVFGHITVRWNDNPEWKDEDKIKLGK
ncbi:hypothetical protein ACFQVC_37365 [Streptomyces monticola]|uniref:Uncharacterized protein n=1 Tax=Streptomyces monticola TaxID=2666263 RepID=A0ABW2JWP5_9ACTN